MFVASAGVLSVSHRTDPSVLPRYLKGNNHALAFADSKGATHRFQLQQLQRRPPPALEVAISPRLSFVSPAV